jgi:hypothetical protein
MKKTRITIGFTVLLVLLGLLISRCTVKNTTDVNLKSDKELRKLVFNEILSDQELLNEFMNTAMEQDSSMYWMMDNQNFMHSMFSSDNFSHMMNHPSGMGNYMMEEMYRGIASDSVLSDHWQNMMQDYDMHQGMMHN